MTSPMSPPNAASEQPTSPVLYDVADGVATIRLNRPEAMNSLDIATKELLRDTVQEAAADRHWWYISPLQEQWVTPANYLDVIDVGAGKRHPSDRGHAYLAERLQQALVDRSASTDAVAPAEDESAPVRP